MNSKKSKSIAAQPVADEGVMADIVMDQDLEEEEVAAEGIAEEGVAAEGIAEEGVAAEGIAEEGVAADVMVDEAIVIADAVSAEEGTADEDEVPVFGQNPVVPSYRIEDIVNRQGVVNTTIVID
jgi:hypothetical protein